MCRESTGGCSPSALGCDMPCPSTPACKLQHSTDGHQDAATVQRQAAVTIVLAGCAVTARHWALTGSPAGQEVCKHLGWARDGGRAGQSGSLGHPR